MNAINDQPTVMNDGQNDFYASKELDNFQLFSGNPSLLDEEKKYYFCCHRQKFVLRRCEWKFSLQPANGADKIITQLTKPNCIKAKTQIWVRFFLHTQFFVGVSKRQWLDDKYAFKSVQVQTNWPSDPLLWNMNQFNRTLFGVESEWGKIRVKILHNETIHPAGSHLVRQNHQFLGTIANWKNTICCFCKPGTSPRHWPQ